MWLHFVWKSYSNKLSLHRRRNCLTHLFYCFRIEILSKWNYENALENALKSLICGMTAIRKKIENNLQNVSIMSIYICCNISFIDNFHKNYFFMPLSTILHRYFPKKISLFTLFVSFSYKYQLSPSFSSPTMKCVNLHMP